MKIWSSKVADKYFSTKVREGGVCQRPNCPYCGNKKGAVLQCSHFWGRNKSATRYDFHNCDAFCIGTHFIWEGEKAGAYRDYMIAKLGQKGYDELRKRADSIKSRRQAIIELMEILQ